MKKTMVGVIIMVVAIVGMISWEVFGREALMFTSVLVLNQDVEPYTEITADMLAVKKVYHPNENSLLEADAQSIVGKESTQFIPMATEVQARYFGAETVVVDKNKDEYVYSISVNNLKAYPRSIAKGDQVYIYSMDNLVLSTNVIGLRDSDGNAVTQSDDRSTASGQISSIEIKATSADCSTLSFLMSDNEPLTISYN